MSVERFLILVVALTWGVVLVSEPALASCSYTTVYLPDGRVMTCQVCCGAHGCSQNCY